MASRHSQGRDAKTYSEILYELHQYEAENQRLKENLEVKEEEIKKQTRGTDEAFKNITDVKQSHFASLERVKGELTILQEKNAEHVRMLRELADPNVSKERELQGELTTLQEKNAECVRMLRELADHNFSKEQELQRHKPKASLDETNATFEALSQTKSEFEREKENALEEVKRKTEQLSKAREEGETLQSEIMDMKSNVEKMKEEILCLSKEQEKLQDLRSEMDRKLAGLSCQMKEITKRMSEDIEELQRENKRKVEEYATWRAQAKKDLNGKVAELAKQKTIIKDLENRPPKKKRTGLLGRIRRFFGIIGRRHNRDRD